MMKTKFLLVLLVAFALVAGTARANLLLNPSFEEGVWVSDGTPDFWTHYYTSYFPTHIWHDNADGAHWGDKYMQMKMWGTGSTGWLMQTVRATADKEYAFSVWAKNPPETQQKEAWGYYEWLDTWGEIMDEGYLESLAPSGDEWGLVNFGSITAPPDAKKLIFSLAGVPENGFVGIMFDDVAMYGPNPPTDADPHNQEFMVPYGDGATGDEVVLSWTNTDPSKPGDPVYVYVWFGTDPNSGGSPNYTKVVTAREDVTSVTVNAPPPPTGRTTYYWQVNSCIDLDHINEPNAIEGPLWMFGSLSEIPVSVVIDSNDMITWNNEPVYVKSTIIDDGASDVTILWTAEPNNIVTFVPNEFVENPRVSITRGIRAEALIANPSFEDGLDDWYQMGSGHGTWTGTYYSYANVTPTDGIWCAYVNGTLNSGADDAGLSLTLADTLEADMTYTLTVDVANDGYYKEDVQYKVQLLAGKNVVAEDDNGHPLPVYGVWETSTVVHTSGGASDPNIGLPLEIRLLAKYPTREMNFDNVQFTASPGFAVLPGESYTLTVTVQDDISLDTDTMTIDVYDDECKVARNGLSLAASNLGDINADCQTDLEDLYLLTLKWLEDTSPSEAMVKP